MMQAAAANAERPLRVGVVGVGVMGSNHARVFVGLPGTELVGVADPDRKQAEFVARTLGCAAVTNVEELLDREVDAITIAAPTHLHRDIALTCIAHGVHVMVEKPIASSVDEGREITGAARRAGVTLMVGHVERFNPAVEAIKGAIRGEDILSIAITRVGPFPPRMSNVGVVIDLAVHDIDLIGWFTDFGNRRSAATALQRGRGARGYRTAAIPYRVGRACANQHQLAHAVQGAECHRCHARQVRDG